MRRRHAAACFRKRRSYKLDLTGKQDTLPTDGRQLQEHHLYMSDRPCQKKCAANRRSPLFLFWTISRSGFFKCKTGDLEMRGLNYDSLKWSKTAGNVCKTWDLKMHGLDAGSLRWQESFGHMCRTWDLEMRGLNYDSLKWSKAVGSMPA